MNKFKELQNKHLALLEKSREGQSSGELVQEVEAYIEEVKIAGKDIPSSQQRDQLRANLRFWGAFIYERKKVFPDINLWPSTKKSPAGQWRLDRHLLLAAGILGAITLLTVIGLVIAKLPGFSSVVQTAQQTPSATDINSMEPGWTVALTNTVPPTSAPPTAEATLNSSTTGTASSSPTQDHTTTETATSSPAPVTSTVIAMLPTPTSPVPTPTSPGSAPSYSYLKSDCDQRKIEIKWQDFPPNLPGSQDAVVDLSASGSGETLQLVDVVFTGDPITLELPDPGSDQSYLLQIRQSKYVFDPIIIQFTSDCAYNDLSINYAGSSQIVGESILDIDLALVDWGPTSNSNSNPSPWIAELSIKQNVDGIYMYNGNPFKEETIFVEGSGCSSQPFTIGRASNGKFQEATFSLYLAGPLCPQFGTD